MMNALRSATKRMFDKEIACNNEFLKPSDDRGSQSQRRNADGDLVPHVMPARAQALARRLNIGRGSSSSHTVGKKDRVDMVVVDADDEEAGTVQDAFQELFYRTLQELGELSGVVLPSVSQESTVACNMDLD